jgi:hypothetical protein
MSDRIVSAETYAALTSLKAVFEKEDRWMKVNPIRDQNIQNDIDRYEAKEQLNNHFNKEK